jgi:site-specific DNA-cytosine methylase
MRIYCRMADMTRPPQFLVVENVVGFETSATREALAETLLDAGYHFHEFLLSPVNFGTPYSRPRYFCVARKKPFSVSKGFPEPWTCRPSTLLQAMLEGRSHFDSQPEVQPRQLCTSTLARLHFHAVVHSTNLSGYQHHSAASLEFYSSNLAATNSHAQVWAVIICAGKSSAPFVASAGCDGAAANSHIS